MNSNRGRGEKLWPICQRLYYRKIAFFQLFQTFFPFLYHFEALKCFFLTTKYYILHNYILFDYHFRPFRWLFGKLGLRNLRFSWFLLTWAAQTNGRRGVKVPQTYMRNRVGSSPPNIEIFVLKDKNISKISFYFYFHREF